MTSLRFIQVDAFADRPFTGNPAAVVPLDTWLDDAVLQAIAAENNLAETAFFVPLAGDDADFELRWFTPELEIAMCGHATLASGHVLLGDWPELDSIRFRTRKAGVLEVVRAGDGYALDLPALATTPQALPDAAAAIGGRPVETRWREGGYAVLVYETAAEVRALTPDFAALRPRGNILYVATAPGDDSDIISRAFAPGAGIDEDPVTGTAHALVVPYWAERLGRPRMAAFQASRRSGHLTGEMRGERVVLGGRCVTVIEGVMTV